MPPLGLGEPEQPTTNLIFENKRNFQRSLFESNGEDSILHIVQMSRIFSDSKTFVDMKLKFSPSEVENQFREMILAHHPSPSKEAIEAFVANCFTMENQMEDHIPEDWVASPKIVGRITDLHYAMFAQDLNARWKILCRKIKQEVEEHPDRCSLLFLPHPVIVPGGRFREVYYWDSFWIIRGLLQCEMFNTVKGLLLNFVHLIQQFGMIPNGGRSYYLNRSQPPMFIQMVKEYDKATGDKEFVRAILAFMVQEFAYWQNHHMVSINYKGQVYKMVRFNCEDNGPRPESYFEDYELASNLNSEAAEAEKASLYWELKTGAETGWDYSSRWFIKNGSNEGSLEDTKPRSIIPVDLNCYYALNAQILSEYCTQFEEHGKAQEFALVAQGLTEAVEAVLWNSEDGIWYDYDFVSAKPRKFFSPANLVPLWTETFTSHSNKQSQIKAAVHYVIKQNLGLHPGGLPTSFSNSGQQWDFPNCWPPLEHMVVQGLEKTGLPEAKEMAFMLADKRVRGAYLNFMNKGHMFEKYNATSATRIGGGGEYEIQLGFGWTNGVILDFLDMYADRLTFKNP